MGATRVTLVGILTVSDRASRGEYEDRGGPAMREYLEGILASEWDAVARIVSDDRPAIEEALVELADGKDDVQGCSLILVTGGTGPAPRDVTPEAVEAVSERFLPGFGEAMRAAGRASIPTAILSRQVAGVRGNTLIVALPGSPRAIIECLDAVFGAVPHCVELIGGGELKLHPGRVPGFGGHPR